MVPHLIEHLRLLPLWDTRHIIVVRATIVGVVTKAIVVMTAALLIARTTVGRVDVEVKVREGIPLGIAVLDMEARMGCCE